MPSVYGRSPMALESTLAYRLLQTPPASIVDCGSEGNAFIAGIASRIDFEGYSNMSRAVET